MYASTDRLALKMVNELVPEPECRQSTIHLESIRDDEASRKDAVLDQQGDEGDVEPMRLDGDDDFPGMTAKQAHDGQFVRTVALLPLDPPDMQPLILPLAAYVRLVHFDRSAERRRNLFQHA